MNRTIFHLSGAAIAAALLLALPACTNLKSSRSIDNSEVKGNVLAVQVCSACHGVTGESGSPMFPKLAGQQKEYLQLQLTDFKGHERKDSKGTQYMWGYADLTRQQMDEIVDYFASQAPMKPNAPDAKPAVLTRGQVIFSQGIPEKNVVACAACHGAGGEGNGAIPRLAGQHAHYVLEQIKVFQTTQQRPRGAAMQQVTHDMPDVDSEAVATFIASMGS
jgi:cytochrome c553